MDDQRKLFALTELKGTMLGLFPSSDMAIEAAGQLPDDERPVVRSENEPYGGFPGQVLVINTYSDGVERRHHDGSVNTEYVRMLVVVPITLYEGVKEFLKKWEYNLFH